MSTRLRVPFHSLSGDDLISRGSAGQVYAISRNIAFKCPTQFDNPALPQREEMEESVLKIDNEKRVYKTLMRHRHPNIVHGVLCVQEGLFMQRLDTTLQARLESPLNSESQGRWIRQLASAIAWLENIGYVHGDLRPANILLDRMENIKVGDFDATVKKGEQLLVASEPFCKMDENYETPPAGPISEQFALGSCIYNIRFRHKPYHDLSAPDRVQKMIKGEFPSTSSDDCFGRIISDCWKGHYNSIHAVKFDIFARSKQDYDSKGETSRQIRVDYLESWWLLAECKTYVANERLVAGHELRSGRNTLRYWGQYILHMILSIWLGARYHCHRVILGRPRSTSITL